MREYENLNEWVEATTGEDSWRTIAEKLHTTHSTIKRRLNNHEADAIIELATAYHVNPVAGLVAGGCITSVDVRAYARAYTFEDFTDVEIAQIIVDRLEAREDKTAGNPEEDADVFDLEGLPYVADSSPDEPGLGDEDYHDGP